MPGRFRRVFNDKSIIAMLHLAGDKPVDRALEEMDIFEEEGIDGAIIENYHGSVDDVEHALKEISRRNYKVTIGVNVLPNEFRVSMPLAREYGAKFVQLDHVAGKYASGELNHRDYWLFRNRYNDIAVLGGVHPKYYKPLPGSVLEDDLAQGKSRADAIVVTGAGTGMETPLEKIKEFRRLLGDYPLVVGAGLTPENAYEQLMIADGAIVGSCLKPDNDTKSNVEKNLVRGFMDTVMEARKVKKVTI